MNKLLSLLLASTLVACAADASEDPPREETEQTHEELTNGSAAGSSGSPEITVRVCVEKCDDWCVVKNGRTICGTSCICIYQ
jgi:hypothetical protein